MTARRLLLAWAACAVAACGQEWRADVVGFDWTGHTIAVRGHGKSAWLLHDRDVTRLDSDGTLERFAYVLPIPVTSLTHATPDGEGNIWFGGGPAGRVFHIEAHTWRVREAPAIGSEVNRGFRLIMHAGELHMTPGRPDLSLKRLREGKWRALPDLVVVNAPGKFSAGLLSIPAGLGVFGDHHVGWLDGETNTWRKKSDVHVVLRVRPALGRGGMSTQDPESGLGFVTLGKGARALGAVDLAGRRYFHLTPRLPAGLSDPGETMYVSGAGATRRLNVVSIDQKVRWSIAVGALVRIDHEKRSADVGSAWEVWNAMAWGSNGELVRETDGLSNMVVVGRWMYTQRKNLVRRFHLDEKRHSENMAGHAYGSEWINRGAAMATDGSSRIFMWTGHDRKLWVLHVGARADGRPVEDAGAPELHEMKVDQGAALPEEVGEVTALAWHGERLWAVFNHETRMLWSWDTVAPAWNREGRLPEGVRLDSAHALELLPDGDGLVVLSGKTWARRGADGAWQVGRELPFAAASDGGMAVLEPGSRRVLVILGGGSRDGGVLDLASGGAERLAARAPDAVSVHGRRIWLLESAGVRHLYVYRGHDSDELWRIALE